MQKRSRHCRGLANFLRLRGPAQLSSLTARGFACSSMARQAERLSTRRITLTSSVIQQRGRVCLRR